jgi:FKBP-type peptidyl-prolyl cis-trans isomerase
MRWMMGLGIVLLTVGAAAQDTPTLKSPKEQQSYAVGVDIGNQLRKRVLDVDPHLVSQEFQDALSGSKTLLTDEEVRAGVAELQAEMKRRQILRSNVGSKPDQMAGEAFLAENKKKEGVIALPGGLQYRIVRVGDGRRPGDSDIVECHYRGMLIDGTEFDSSYRRGQPVSFGVTGVIPGWREALKLMSVGSKWQLFIPPELAYGERGAGCDIGPNATLIFEVELLAVK